VGIFKSRDEKELERQIRIKQFMTKIRREIGDCDKKVKTYIQYAKRARQIGDPQSLATSKSGLKQVLVAKRLRERQVLHLEIAMTIRDQAEADVNFAKAMREVSQAISELVKSVNMTEIQMQYERAMTQSETLKEQSEAFIETASQTVQDRESGSEAIVKDDEIDKLIEEEAAQSEKDSMDKNIEKGLKDIEKELGGQ
jgi:hypothetical protein